MSIFIHFVCGADALLIRENYVNAKADDRSLALWISVCYMMPSPNGYIFRVTGHLCGEFTGLR